MITRGDLWIVDLEPGLHREMHKKRPAVIISASFVQEQTPYVIIIPASSQVPTFLGPEMIELGKEEGLDKPSVFLPLFIRSIDQKRLIEKIGRLSSKKLLEVEEALRLILSI